MDEVVIECCDPRDWADEIQGLFDRNDRGGFRAVFERVYRQRADAGLKSWIGHKGDKVVMHVSMTPQWFSDGSDRRLGAFLGDLLVDAPIRNFWEPVRLVRSMIADLKREGEVDFVVNATNESAAPVFRAAKFDAVGRMRRYVLPLNSAYLLFHRLRNSVRGVAVEELPGTGWVGDSADVAASGGRWRPVPDDSYYATRLGTSTYKEGQWLSVFDKRGRSVGKVLTTRHQNRSERGIADCFCNEKAAAAGVMLGAARWARAGGSRKLAVSVPEGADIVRDLRRAGFLRRDPEATLLYNRLNDSAPTFAEIFFFHFSLSNW